MPHMHSHMPCTPNQPCAAVLLITGYTGYTVYKQNQDNELLSGIPAGFSRCTLSVYDNPPGESSREALARKNGALDETGAACEEQARFGGRCL